MDRKPRNTDAMRKASEGGAIITWTDRDENAPPPKPTKQKSLGDYAPVIIIGGVAAVIAAIMAMKATGRATGYNEQPTNLCPSYTFPSGKVAVSTPIPGSDECQWPDWVQCLNDSECPEFNKCVDGGCVPPARAIDPYQSYFPHSQGRRTV